MQNLAKVSALKEFEQIEELVKKRDIDLQNEFQKGKKEGEDAEKEQYMQEKKEADKMNKEHMQKADVAHQAVVSELNRTIQRNGDQLKEKEDEIRKLMTSAEKAKETVSALEEALTVWTRTVQEAMQGRAS